LWIANASNRQNTGAVSVRLESNNSRIYGGGGGGGQGGQGNSGGTINCWVDGPREAGNNNNAFPSLAGMLIVAKPNNNDQQLIANQHSSGSNVNYNNHRWGGGSDNPGRACGNDKGTCPTNWKWTDSTSTPAQGWVTGTIKNGYSGTGHALNNCREWGYNANFEIQNHPNQSDGNTSQRQRCRGRDGERGASYGNASSCTVEYVRICQYRHNFQLTPSSGGSGGAGGRGEGVGDVTNQSGATTNLAPMSGANGGNGQTITCNTTGEDSSSNSGGQGGNGGHWGQPGNDGNGSSPGNGAHEGWGICRTNNSQPVDINGSGNPNNCILGGSGHQNQNQ
jgi:hypothetical protein